MKKAFFIPIVLFISTTHAQDLAIPTFLEKWENSKNYLLALVEAMPEDKYEYKPSERQMSFEEQLQHIMKNMSWLGTTYLGVQDAEILIINDKKERFKQNIKNSFSEISSAVNALKTEDLVTKVDFFAGEKTKFQILNLLQDHVTHHRGQLVVYLNLNDIKPPAYVGW